MLVDRFTLTYNTASISSLHGSVTANAFSVVLYLPARLDLRVSSILTELCYESISPIPIQLCVLQPLALNSIWCGTVAIYVVFGEVFE